MENKKLYMMKVIDFKRTEHSYSEKGLLFNDGQVILDAYGVAPEHVWNYFDSMSGYFEMTLDGFFGPYEYKKSPKNLDEDKVTEVKQIPDWIEKFYGLNFSDILFDKIHVRDLHPSISVEVDAYEKGKYIENSVYLKTMSHGGETDELAADYIEQYLKTHEIEYKRYDTRRFEIYGPQYLEHFMEETNADS